MGGLDILETLLEYPDLFGYVHIMSSGWSSDRKELYEADAERMSEVAPVLKKTVRYLKFSTGGLADGASVNAPPTREIFSGNGIPSEFSEWREGTPCMCGVMTSTNSFRRFSSRRSSRPDIATKICS